MKRLLALVFAAALVSGCEPRTAPEDRPIREPAGAPPPMQPADPAPAQPAEPLPPEQQPVPPAP